jgi:FkbM family methyltransferase
MSSLRFAFDQGLKFQALWWLAKFTRRYRPPKIDRFLRLVYSPDRRQHDHINIAIEYDVNLMINVNTASFLEWCIFFYGYYEPEIDALIKRLFRTGFVAFDVGANIGMHALIMGQYAGNTGKIVAVEPNPRIHRRLIENISLNRLANIQPMQCGLSNTRGERTLHLAPDDFPHQGMSSLYPQPELTNKTTIQVNALDEIAVSLELERLDFIKIDTEGNDYNVLLGGEMSIQRYRPYILFEYVENTWSKGGFQFAMCEELFAKHKYMLYALHPKNYLKQLKGKVPASANILAIPESY